MKAREVKRAKLVARYAEKRAALKKIIATADVNTEEGAMAAYEAARKLQSIPKNANPIRLHNRCKITGRPKGYMRQFGLSRIQFREMASSGLIPGVKKAYWNGKNCGRRSSHLLYSGPHSTSRVSWKRSWFGAYKAP